MLVSLFQTTGLRRTGWDGLLRCLCAANAALIVPQPFSISMLNSRLLVLCLLALAACVAPAPQVRVKIAGGERIVVSMRDGTVEGSQSKFVKVDAARLVTNSKEKKAFYAMGLYFTQGAVPAVICVEDVSDEKPVLLLKDEKPVLTKNFWRQITPQLDIAAESMKWMHDIDDSFRVYRFSITLLDGQKINIFHATIYGGMVKAGMMKVLTPIEPEASAP
jgi:hypothetical protein